jgi:hypothetical protein
MKKIVFLFLSLLFCSTFHVSLSLIDGKLYLYYTYTYVLWMNILIVCSNYDHGSNYTPIIYYITYFSPFLFNLKNVC